MFGGRENAEYNPKNTIPTVKHGGGKPYALVVFLSSGGQDDFPISRGG